MDWEIFFLEAAEVFDAHRPYAGDTGPSSWCSWTTYRRLQEDAGYWTAPLPNRSEVGDLGILDGGTWGQPFLYEDLAHIVIPRKFYWEKIAPEGFKSNTEVQPIEVLSKQLDLRTIPHRLTNLLLEIKLY